MLNPTKMTEPSSVTDAGWSGNMDALLSSLQGEVNSAIHDMIPEMILLLIDKMEGKIAKKEKLGKLELSDLLAHYVALKIAKHHLVRKYERNLYCTPCGPEETGLKLRIINLNNKVKEARENYYVAKRRVEGQHESGCSCRGCRCIEGI